MAVLETILSYEYLWTKIRIRGGAYGVTARFELNGVGVLLHPTATHSCRKLWRLTKVWQDG